MYYNNSRINKSDGVLIYIEEDVSEETEIITVDKIKIINTRIHLNNTKKLEISSLYRSHDIPKVDFVQSIKEYLIYKKSVKNHLIVGDFNIDLLSYDNISQELTNNFLEEGFTPGFQGVTRPSENGGSCIDNVFIKSTSLSVKTAKLIHSLTDHYPLFISINKIKKKNSSSNCTQIDYKKLLKLAQEVNWNSILLITDPDEATNVLINKIVECTGQSRTTTQKNRNSYNGNTPRSDWITQGIMISCKYKEMLYRLWKADPHNLTAKQTYTNYNKILDKVIKLAKLLFDKKQVELNKGNIKNLWKYINDKLGKTAKSIDSIKQIYINNNHKITDSQEIANYMNSYFCSIGNKLAEKIVQPSDCSLSLPQDNPESIYLFPTTSQEVLSIIRAMEVKGGGIDNINVKTLKVLADSIAHILQYIFNLCMEKAVWPASLKNAEIKPIHKAKSKSQASNYRPISMISNIAKVFEKIIHNRILTFINKHNIISNMQFGFMKNRGTTEALQFVSNTIYNSLDKSQPIAAAFLDLAKAFDTVDHQILIMKLSRYGIRGSPLQLIESYLENRQQRVKANEATSDYLTVQTGVPQGTILGPLLFILYINDMLTGVSDNTIISYADDTAIIVSDKTWTGVESKLNRCLDRVAKWLALNKLSLNVDKTVCLTFGSYYDSVPEDFNICVDGVVVKRVSEHRYLGVIFDYNMKWGPHINYILSKTKYLVFVFYKLSKFMLTETLRMIFFAFFHSVASYGIIAWGCAYGNNLGLLQRLQYRLLKIVNKNKFFTTQNPPRIDQLHAYAALIFHYHELKQKFVNSTSTTRNKQLRLPKINKTIGKKMSMVTATSIYNRLPMEFKKTNLSSTWKKRLKEWIKNNL